MLIQVLTLFYDTVQGVDSTSAWRPEVYSTPWPQRNETSCNSHAPEIYMATGDSNVGTRPSGYICLKTNVIYYIFISAFWPSEKMVSPPGNSGCFPSLNVQRPSAVKLCIDYLYVKFKIGQSDVFSY